jgi:2-isopropylmalate synthase
MKDLENKIFLYDTTLRDGGQTAYVDFTTQNKIDLAKELDNLGVDYIEAGWPGSNPTDNKFFANLPKLNYAQITAFGMTHRINTDPATDAGFAHLVDSGAKYITIVGKSWDFQVTDALKISLDENLYLIENTVRFLQSKGKEVFFDAEHFFDGYKENPEYAMKAIKAAYKAGARWIIACDTNGGTLPHEISKIISEVVQEIPGHNIGIHCHNDTGNAVANSLAAIFAGARQIQGTLNGLGERCGNANFTSLIPTLKYKTNFEISISNTAIKKLKSTANFLYDVLNAPYDNYAPYVGSAAFSHKGGLHASGVAKNAKCYEHIDPELVGNNRNILVSNQSGKAAIIARLDKLNFDYRLKKIDDLVAIIKEKEMNGFAYDSADASFAILAYEFFHGLPKFFELESYKVINERRINIEGNLVNSSEAIVKLNIAKKRIINVAEGNGPVAALDNAFKASLVEYYPILKQCTLSDYKVRILNSEAATSAVTRVLIETTDHKGHRWVSIGVGTDLIDASYMALNDAIKYLLLFGVSGSVN